MITAPPLDERTLEIIKENESTIIRALERYYLNFGRKKGVGFNEAARNAYLNPALVVAYMFYQHQYTLGMPSDHEEAMEYLQNLRKLKETLHL